VRRFAAVAVAGFLFASALTAAGCRSKDGPAGVADAFMGAYYVAIELNAAREFTTGLAREKLDRELELTSEVSIDPETRKPRINFQLEESSEEGERARFIFVLDIRPPGIDPYERTSILSLKQVDGDWKVSNFNDTDRKS
jgi:hypothetical protein